MSQLNWLHQKTHTVAHRHLNSIDTYLVSSSLKRIQLGILRLDNNHSFYGGNKVLKLDGLAEFIKAEGFSGCISFGGAYSNHLLALAKYCEIHSISFTAYVRCHEIESGNPNIETLKKMGTEVRALKPEIFDQQFAKGPLFTAFESELKETQKDKYIIPMGGGWKDAVENVRATFKEIIADYDIIFVPIGSGVTLQGLIKAAEAYENKKIIGISCIATRSLKELNLGEIGKPNKINDSGSEYFVVDSYTFGGFFKFDAELITFINNFYEKTKIPIEPTYSGKMFWAIDQLIKKPVIPANSQVLGIHTGGLFSVLGLEKRKNIQLNWHRAWKEKFTS